MVARSDIAQGDIWWADFGYPAGSSPGYIRPVVVVQGDPINASRIATVVVVPLTSNLKWANTPGNVVIAGATGLDRDSVALVASVSAIDRSSLTERVGRISPALLRRILSGIDVILGR